MNERKRLMESLRDMEDGMLLTGTAEHISMVDFMGLLWSICKALYLLLKKEVER